MRRVCPFIFLLCLPGWLSAKPDVFQAIIRPAFKTHCIKCHGKGGKVKGKVNLLNVKGVDGLLHRPELMEDMIVALKDEDMPPEDEPPLKPELRKQLLRELKGLFDQAIAAQGFAPTPIRRMNRFQYNNAVVDLLELDRGIFALHERLMRRRSDYFHPEKGEMPSEVKVSCRPLSKDQDRQRAEGFFGVAAFPQDLRAEHGYDNRADHLTLSPLLMESFLRLGQTIVESKDLNAKECRSWKTFFEAPPAEKQASELHTRIATFLRRAWRRPVEAETLDRFTAFATKTLADGASFTDAMKSVAGAAIASPDFIYLYDRAGEQALGKVDEFELAARLSFFLWSSIPDDTLLDLAAEGKLSEEETLNAQLDRMLNDRRMERFCDSFPSQWLQLDRLVAAIPDPVKFKNFYFHGDSYRASMHMMMEPLLLFETVFLENRSIIDLIQPDFTYTTDVLNNAYKGENKAKRKEVVTMNFKREPVEDPRRGGVITSAAVLTMTSSPLRTQPITRGAWVNTVIFNDPPDPPPADVPPLPEADPDVLARMTLRERLEDHRKREDCASCHNQLDPLGFALENYGPTGVWRDHYENGLAVDPSGKLFNKYPFKTPEEFRAILMKEKGRYLRAFAGHLLSYALGRELTPADSPALDRIKERALDGEDGLRDMLKMVGQSEPFHHKNTSGIVKQESKHEN
ncbi:MAG: DUF1592 domain-containing protein [Verrucomicrobiota bacterium]